MKKIIKILSVILVICLLFTACSGGSEKSKKNTELTMYLVGDKPADYDKVLEKINEKLAEDIGVNLKVLFLGWGEWSQKYPLLLSSGDGVDMIYTAAFMNYKDYAKKGAFLDITELMKEHAPKAYQALDKRILDMVNINGKIYTMPANNAEVNGHGYVVRGDLMDKYNIPDIKNGDDFMNYLKIVKENEDIMPYNASKTDPSVYPSKYVEVAENVYYDTTDEENFYKKLYTYEDKEFEDYYQYQAEKIRDGYLNGYWPKDVLMNQTPAKDAFAAGTSASAIINLLNFNDLYAKVMATNPEWEPRYYYRGTSEKIPVEVTAGSGIAVTKNSKHPEKCLQVIELLNVDREYNRLTTFGFEGKHYVETKPGRYSFPEGVDINNTGFVPDQAGNWAWRNPEHFMYADTAWPKYEEVRDECASYALWNPYAAFVFDDTSVLNEVSSIKGIEGENSDLICWGLVERNEVRPAEIKKLKTAGVDKVIKEAKAQISEFVKNKK